MKKKQQVGSEGWKGAWPYYGIKYNFNVIFRDEDKPKNPMVELFYGRFLAVGVLEGIVAYLLLYYN